MQQYVRTLHNACHQHSRVGSVVWRALSALEALFRGPPPVCGPALAAAQEKGVLNIAFEALRMLHNESEHGLEISRSASAVVQQLLDTCRGPGDAALLAPMERTALLNGGINHLFFCLRWNWKKREVVEPALNVLALLTNPYVLHRVPPEQLPRVCDNRIESTRDLCSMLSHYVEDPAITYLTLKVLCNMLLISEVQ